MIFLNPTALILFILLPLSILLWVRWQRNYKRQLSQLTQQGVAGQQMLPEYMPRHRGHFALWVTVVSLLIVALARPAWGSSTDTIEVQGVSVVIVMDVSSSMLAEDVLPNRLERAKTSAYRMLEALQGHEVGLVIFAGQALTYFPLTTDTLSATAFLNAISTQSITAQGTALNAALETGLSMFNATSPAARIMVVMTDGENHEGDLSAALNLANNMGVMVHTIGYGDPAGAPIPVINEQGITVAYKTDETGNHILSELGEETLEFVAAETDGIYQHARSDGSEIEAILYAIDQSQTGALNTQSQTRTIERFEIPVVAAILILWFEIILPKRRRSVI